MFKVRLLSGIVLIATLLAIVIPGGSILLYGSLFIALVGLMEFYRVLGVNKTLLGFFGYLCTAVYYGVILFFAPPSMIERMLLLLTVVLMVAVLAVYVLTYPKYPTEKILGVFFGFFYVAVLLSYIFRTRELVTDASPDIGKYLVWLIFLCSWGSDTFAYCVGMLFGKHKMSPVLSPKKTWEGAVGGVIGAAALTALFAFVFRGAMGLLNWQIFALSLTGAAGAVISMIGDLAASAVKRNYNIKDYGKLIPGHGGILDRFDSVIFTAPAVYYLAVVFLS